MGNYLIEKVNEIRSVMKKYEEETADIRTERIRIFEKLQSAIDKDKIDKIRLKINK